jgi:hypothetical protein
MVQNNSVMQDLNLEEREEEAKNNIMRDLQDLNNLL